MSHHRRTGKCDRTTQLRNHEAVLRMGFWACLVPVMAAKHFLDLVQRLMALGTRLPLPEKNKALSAHATMNFGVPVRAFAEDLHLEASFFRRALPFHKDESSPLRRW